MKVIFTRHGETQENVAGISMGQGLDGTLNNAGIRQAQKLAHRLKNERIEHVYTSDLKRALDTANEILRFHPGAELVPTLHLRERNLGSYEGGPREHWKKAMKESPLPFHAFKPEKGESYQELQERVKNFWQQVSAQHPYDNLLIVSHTGTLTMLFLHLYNRPVTLEEYEQFKPDNTAITICEFDVAGQCTTHLLNSTEHLGV
jgi:broad specificity phosphatase PhoE